MKIGEDHLELFDKLARTVSFNRPLHCIVDWGCGGGANAVHFAPLADTYVGVDVVADTLEECARQVATVSRTTFVPVLVDLMAPEAGLDHIPGPCDLFLCVYVLELVPTPEYGLRLIAIAEKLLSDGGLALIQIKYEAAARGTRSRRRGYRSDPSTMTSYRIDEFWTAVQERGLKPEVLFLVPENDLDRRYAYFLLSKDPQ